MPLFTESPNRPLLYSPRTSCLPQANSHSSVKELPSVEYASVISLDLPSKFGATMLNAENMVLALSSAAPDCVLRNFRGPARNPCLDASVACKGVSTIRAAHDAMSSSVASFQPVKPRIASAGRSRVGLQFHATIPPSTQTRIMVPAPYRSAYARAPPTPWRAESP